MSPWCSFASDCGSVVPKWEGNAKSFFPGMAQSALKSAKDPNRVLERRRTMSGIKTLLKILAFTCILVATAIAISTPVSNNQPAVGNDPAFKTAMQPDLTLKTVISPDLLPQPSQTAAARRHGFCRCSCGYPCQTSADCGGVSCDPFITCCEKDPQKDSFQQGIALSSHKSGEPAVNVKCK